MGTCLDSLVLDIVASTRFAPSQRGTAPPCHRNLLCDDSRKGASTSYALPMDSSPVASSYRAPPPPSPSPPSYNWIQTSMTLHGDGCVRRTEGSRVEIHEFEWTICAPGIDQAPCPPRISALRLVSSGDQGNIARSPSPTPHRDLILGLPVSVVRGRLQCVLIEYKIFASAALGMMFLAHQIKHTHTHTHTLTKTRLDLSIEESALQKFLPKITTPLLYPFLPTLLFIMPSSSKKSKPKVIKITFWTCHNCFNSPMDTSLYGSCFNCGHHQCPRCEVWTEKSYAN
ncbi:hypothetical protein GE09DRAFT_197185 [Coniochaeta sp. 2T2.1]|nr:hypothetical protein GE09DRAFT_197185 [Coniochaeta sp. 2T2.1]